MLLEFMRQAEQARPDRASATIYAQSLNVALRNRATGEVGDVHSFLFTRCPHGTHPGKMLLIRKSLVFGP